MNKHIITFLCGTFLLTLFSCGEYLKEDLIADISSSSHYTSEAGTEDAVKATYSALKPYFGTEIGFTMANFGTDMSTNGADGSYKEVNWYDANLNSTNKAITETWKNFYIGINQANAVIHRIGQVEGMNEELKDVRVAEVRFLRALFYYVLTETYGDIHLSLEETTGVQTQANKTSQEEIYSRAIIPDLEYAISQLPDAQPERGRATKPAAQFLLGKALLTRSYRSYAAPDDASRAEDLLSSVIDDYNFSLAATYRELFGLNERDEGEFITAAETLPEIIFSVQNSKAQVDQGLDIYGNSGHLYFLAQYDNLPGMKRDIANGRPWKQIRPTAFSLSLWDRAKDRRYDDTYKKVWYANNESSIPKWTQADADAGYIPGSAVGRPKFSLGDTAVYYPGPGEDAEWNEGRKKRTRYLVITGDAYSESLFPSLNKWIDDTRPDMQKEQGQRDFPLMRLGEAYLLRAEARLRQGNTEGAADDINVIRRRAAWPGKEAEMEISAGEVTIDFLLDEMGRELDGECTRWFELVRTGKLVERVRLHNPEAAPNIEDYHVRRPIPQTQIDRTEGGYPQNCGYPGGVCD